MFIKLLKKHYQHTRQTCKCTLCPYMVPRTFDIDGNEKADKLAKSGSYLTPMKPNYKSLSYLGSLHKHKIGEEWRHRWANNYTTLCSKFHIANHIPPTTHPTNRFLTLDQCMFSWTIQCRTGHTHIGEYYQWFVPNEEQECHCRKTLQTQNHLLFKCKAHQWHWHLLGTGETRNIEALLGSEKGIRRLTRFLKASGAYEKMWYIKTTQSKEYTLEWEGRGEQEG